MEDCSIFNAGKGSKHNVNLEYELEASIMDGANLNFGAVSLVKNIKNPIKLARKLMDIYQNLILFGNNALEFAKNNGLDIISNNYYTSKNFDEKKFINTTSEYGTIGCVLLDQNKNLSAGISTGGKLNKICGRLGDASIIGAGLYANNSSCAISCTGKGEIFIKNCIAYDLHSRLIYKKESLKKASEDIINQLEKNSGGFISLDKNGNLEMPFNTKGMVRGWVDEKGIAYINLFKENEDYTPSQYIL
jgi:beta-aspartyl-peptidase (threonine type)